MNTTSEWTLTVRIDDPKQRELWRDVFPDGVMPVASANIFKTYEPECGLVPVYFLDLYALSDYLLADLARVIAERFNYTADEVKAVLSFGFPIVAEGVTLCVAVQHDEA